MTDHPHFRIGIVFRWLLVNGRIPVVMALAPMLLETIESDQMNLSDPNKLDQPIDSSDAGRRQFAELFAQLRHHLLGRIIGGLHLDASGAWRLLMDEHRISRLRGLRRWRYHLRPRTEFDRATM